MKIKQKNIPPLGAFIESLYTALPALSIINFFLIVIAVYEPVRNFMTPLFPGFNFTWFIVVIGVITGSATIIMYLFVVPSLNTFRFNQMNKFDSPVLKEMRKLREDLANAGIGEDHEDEEATEKLVKTARDK